DKVVTVLTAHTGQVEDIAYSPDGKLLATASIDHTVRIWDAHTGRLLRILYHPDPVDAVGFGPTSDKVATLDYAGTIRIWDACTDCENSTALLALAKHRVTRQLTPAARRTVLGNCSPSRTRLLETAPRRALDRPWRPCARPAALGGSLARAPFARKFVSPAGSRAERFRARRMGSFRTQRATG